MTDDVKRDYSWIYSMPGIWKCSGSLVISAFIMQESLRMLLEPDPPPRPWTIVNGKVRVCEDARTRRAEDDLGSAGP